LGVAIIFPSWILALLIASFMGSFLGVIVMRNGAFASALTGRSACETCGHRLRALDLAPLLSWALLGGKCRYCKAPIGLFYPAIELGAVVVALWSASVFSGAALWVSCGLGWTLLALAATDLKYFLLPDVLTLPLIAAGLLANAALDGNSLADQALRDRILGAAAGYVFVRTLRFIYRLLRGREGIGLGDAKLFAAAGAWISWQGLPSVLVIASLFALAAVLVWREPGIEVARRVPFGVFLAMGLWITWLYGPLTAG
jgi:leader peptidase (prepilin peptidase)/N-methyltransferase